MLAFLIHRQSELSETKVDNQEEPKKEDETSALQSVESEQKQHFNRGDGRRLIREKLQEDVSQGEIKLFGIVKSLAAALFIVLCVTAVSALNGVGKMEDVQNYFQQAFHAMKEKKIPDREEIVPTTAQATDTELMLQENELQQEEQQTANDVSDMEMTNVPEKTVVNENAVVEKTMTEEVVAEETTVVEISAEAQEPLTHTIQAGETLISISKAYYGNDSMVQTICELNGIANSDNIQVGQKIILP